jgi:hypothetical protein
VAARWTSEAKDFIRGHAAILKDDELAASLSLLTGRSISTHAVRKARARLGLKKKQGRGRCELSSAVPAHGINLRLTGA